MKSSTFWQQPIVIASYRALVGAVVMTGVAFFGVLQAGGGTRPAEIAAGAAFFGYLALRAGIEGIIDQTTTTPPAPVPPTPPSVPIA